MVRRLRGINPEETVIGGGYAAECGRIDTYIRRGYPRADTSHGRLLFRGVALTTTESRIGNPSRILPVDVVATLSVNSFLSSATAFRSVHRGLAEQVERLLTAVSMDADLRTKSLDQLVEVLDAACQLLTEDEIPDLTSAVSVSRWLSSDETSCLFGMISPSR